MSAQGIWLGSGADALFGMLHPPRGGQLRSTAVVIIPPLGYEAICAEPVLRNLAEHVASRGFWVLRYDHASTGDSAGELDQPERLAAWIAGVQRVSSALSLAVDATGVALIGLRAGALLALAAARNRRECKALVLWAAPPSGRALVHELRAMSGFGAAAAKDGTLEAAGFSFCADTLRELSQLHAAKLEPPPEAPVMIIPRDDIAPPPPSAFGAWLERAELVALPGYAQALRDPHQSSMPEPTLAAIASWIEAACPGLGSGASVVPTTRVQLKAHVSAASPVWEEAVRFGPDQRLFGIVTEPSAESDGPFVLWLNPGAISRIGMNRNYVTFARALAAHGVSSLRFDVSGIGDSASLSGMPERRLYSEHVVPDVRQAMDYLAATRRGRSKFVLVGLCSGAYAAFHSALADERVAGVVLINPQTFAYRPGDELEVTRRRAFQSARWYRRSALRLESWKKALRGEVDLPRVFRLLSARALTVTRDGLASLGPRSGQRRQLADAFRRLLERETRVLAIYSADDPGLDHLRERLGGELARLRRDPRFELRIFEGPDHTFSPVWSQAALYECLKRHLIEHHGARASDGGARASTQALVASVRRQAKHAAARVLPQSWLVVHGPRRRRRIALSFDDGPTELTREYLDVLASFGVCATFFLLGNACRRLPAFAESIALAGHEIGGHGYTHRTFPELAGEALLRELRETDAVLPGLRNGRRLVRPPHGSVSPRSLLECVRAGFTTVLWSYDSGDSRMQTAPEILQAFERAPPQAGDIVLLHEDHRRTLEALPVLLERLTRSGYELVTVSDLFRGEARP